MVVISEELFCIFCPRISNLFSISIISGKANFNSSLTSLSSLSK